MKLKLITATILFAAGLAQSAIAGPLSIQGGKFFKDGKPFYGVGVNYFDGFYRYAVFNDGSALSTGLADLKRYNVPFVRVPAIVFWPTDIQRSYLQNRVEFYKRLDAFMDAAKAQGIGVVLDVFYNWTAFPDIKNEHLPAIGNQTSLSRQMMREILNEIVPKYKNHSALWAWEFANEATKAMDIPPSVGNNIYQAKSPANGSPDRTPADNVKPSDIISALQEFATIVRDLDPATPIFSGNDVPYYCAFNMQQNGSWQSDSYVEFAQILERDNPAPIDTLSMHLYSKAEGAKGKYFAKPGQESTATYTEFLSLVMAQSHVSRRPFFLGEFGVSDEEYSDAAYRFEEITKAIMDNRVSMSALWVYDYKVQNGAFNVTSTNARKYQLEKVRDMNIEMATWQ